MGGEQAQPNKLSAPDFSEGLVALGLQRGHRKCTGSSGCLLVNKQKFPFKGFECSTEGPFFFLIAPVPNGATPEKCSRIRLLKFRILGFERAFGLCLCAGQVSGCSEKAPRSFGPEFCFVIFKLPLN